MKRSRRFVVLWTIWMVVGGLAIALIVYVFTGSVVWAVVGLLASSVVLNMIGQMVTRPVDAITKPRSRETDSGDGDGD